MQSLYKYSTFLFLIVYFKEIFGANNIKNENWDLGNFGKFGNFEKDDEMAQLQARLIYKDILPRATVADLKNDEFLNALIDYFHLAIDKVKYLTDGQTQRINLMAMCDVLGQYFHNILIPVTKDAYYSGTLNYDTTKQVVNFYDNIKYFLNGDESDFHSKRNFWNPQIHANNKLLRNSKRNPCDQITYTNEDGFIYIPTPFFDSKKNPTTIALPFKNNPLTKLDHKNAINCLANFYSTVNNCLREKRATEENIRKFNSEFETFLQSNVYPHLSDDKIYPAFGAIYKIKHEIREKIMKRAARVDLKEGGKVDEEEEEIEEPRKKHGIFGFFHSITENMDNDDYAPIIALICISSAIVVWLCIYFFKHYESGFCKREAPCQKDKFDKRCPKCRKKRCRCMQNIWSALSHCTVTYPRLFSSRQNTATSPLLEKPSTKTHDDKVAPPKTKTSSPKHTKKFSVHKQPQNQFMVEMTTVFPKQLAKNIPSVPVRAGDTSVWQPENTSSQTNTESKDKVFVFGYDFETSSDDTSSSSGFY